eukprot:191726-Chlamydomonas_euryale.AAC.2
MPVTATPGCSYLDDYHGNLATAGCSCNALAYVPWHASGRVYACLLEIVPTHTLKRTPKKPPGVYNRTGR